VTVNGAIISTTEFEDRREAVKNHSFAVEGHQTPIQALQKWRVQKPDLFVKRVYEQAGLDT
jgi:hypothetical protein